MADCQFYLFRDPDTKDSIAIIEIPISQCMPNAPLIDSLTLTGVRQVYLQPDKSWMTWIGRAQPTHGKIIEIKFIWDTETIEKYPTESFRFIIGNSNNDLELECIGEAEAKTLLVIAQLDYFRAKSVIAVTDEESKVEALYVGRVDPEG